jgi:hypothetical protein
MQVVGTLWRRLAGAFVAFTLAAFVFGPTLDALICHDDGAVSAAGFESGDRLAASDDGGGDHTAPQPHQPCPHGHCHHGGQSALTTLADAAIIDAKAERQAAAAPERLATRTPPSLERPPRA